MLLDPFREVFTPFSRANETILLSVPAGNKDGPERLPAVAEKESKATDKLTKRDSARGRVRCTHDPCITVVAKEDDFILNVPWNSSVGVPNRGHLRVDMIDQVDLLVTDLAVELTAYVDTAQLFKEALCVCPRNGQTRDLRNVATFRAG